MTDLDAIRAMSDAELDVAIAVEIMGWTGGITRAFAADLNAVAEVEAKIVMLDNGAGPYCDALANTTAHEDWRWLVTTPARQRAEACLLAWRRMNGGAQ